MKANILKSKTFLIIIAIVLAFGAGYGVKSMCKKPCVAVLDMRQVVAKSPKVQAVRAEKSLRLRELSVWLDEAKLAIDKEKNEKNATS